MIQDLNDIYNPDTETPDLPVKPKPSKQAARAVFSPGPGPVNAGGSFANVSPTNVKEYADYMPEGVYDERNPRESLDLLRGARQSFGEKIGRRLANLVPNIAADLIDMTGSSLSLLTEWGDERDYRNGLNELADSMKDPFGKTYKRSNDTWALGDPTWWIDNAFNTIEYAGAYALGGIGVAKAIGGLGRAVSGMVNAGIRANNFIMGAAELGTSAFVSYAQGAQDGSTVFKEVFENQLRKRLAAGDNVQTARDTATHIAAQSAATTAQLSTILTMAINSSAYSPVLKSQETLEREVLASRIAEAQSKGLGMGETGKLLRSTSASDYKDKLFYHAGIKGMLTEMVKEGGEEVLQQFAQQTGNDIGNKGQTKGFFQQFGEIENLIDRTANSQGLLAFTLGAAFGGLQHSLIHNIIPSRYTEKMNADGTPMQRFNDDGTEMTDKNGNPVFQKHWVTPRTYEHDFTQRSFDNVKDAIAHDYEQFEQSKDEFLAARKEKNPIKADEARDEMFNSGKLYAIKAGMEEPWVKTFEQVAAMTPEQAVEAGYAESTEDTAYKQRAEDAIADIGHLKTVYGELNKRYDTANERNAGLRPYVDMIFAREADLYSTRKRLDQYKKSIEEDENKAVNLLGIKDTDMYNEAMRNFFVNHASMKEVNRQLHEDVRTLNDNQANPVIVNKLLKKYRAIGYGEGSRDAAITDLLGKLQRKSDQVTANMQNAETALIGTTDYSTWVEKNPEGSFDQFLKEANEKTDLFAQNRFRKVQLDQAEAQYDIARQNMNDMVSEKNQVRFTRKAEQWRRELEQESERLEQDRAAKLAEMTKDKTTLNRLERIGLNQIADKHRADRDAIHEQIKTNQEIIGRLRTEQQGLRHDPIRAMSIRRQLNNATKENTLLGKRAAILDSLYRTYAVDQAPVVDPVAVEDVTGEQDGKTVADSETAATTGTTPQQGVQFEDISEPVTIQGETVEEIANEIENTAQVYTIQDEMNLLRNKAQELSPIAQKYNKLVQALGNENTQARVELEVERVLDGDKGFSLDIFKHLVDRGEIPADKVGELVLAAKDYIDEFRQTLAAQNMVPDSEVDSRIADIENRRREELNKLSMSPVRTDFYNIKVLLDLAESKDNQTYVSRELMELAYANDKDNNPKNNGNSFTQSLEDIIRRGGYSKGELVKQLQPEYNRINAKYNAEIAALPNEEVIVSDVSNPDSPEVETSLELNGTPVENNLYHAGFKIIDAALTGATSTIGYEEGVKINKDGKKTYVKVTKPTELVKPVIKSILDPKGLPAGHPLIYEVHWEYEGEKQITDNLSWDSNQEVQMATEKGTDYLDKNGKVPKGSIGNIPIRVRDGVTGEYLFHLRKVDWIQAKFPGTKDYRNVVESTEEIADNVKYQTQLLMDLRTRIANQYNADGTGVPGKIAASGKGTGRLILNHVIESKGTEGELSIKSKVVPKLAYDRMNPEKSLLPDSSLEMVIILKPENSEPTAYSGRNYAFNKPLGIDISKYPNGAVGAMIQSANGQYILAPLLGMKLVENGKPSPALASVTRVIELYILDDGTDPTITAEIDSIERSTNFNIGTAQGLRAFVNQYYTYSQNFQDSALSPNAKTGKKVEKFVFSIDDNTTGITDKTKQIKTGFTVRGDGVQYANLVNGKLSPDFTAMLQEGFASRSRAVVFTDNSLGIRGINSQGSFTDANYIPGKGWKFNEHEDYNQYVKSFSRTPVYGRNQVDGKYVYTANPQLPIEAPDKVNTPVPAIVKPNNNAIEVKSSTTDIAKLDSDFFDNLGNPSYRVSPPVVQGIGTGSAKSVPLTLEGLQEKYNFTPEDQRNGKTVREVLEELSNRGINYLSDGYNPFSRCL